MSLILKGIDLPDNDRYTTLRIYKNGHIWLGKTLVGIAIQIPKEHGKLIDANKVRDNILEGMDFAGYQSWVIDVIDFAPSILESEEEWNEFYYKRY